MHAKKSPARPMGQAGSAKWNALLDTAEDILREEGYRALTSRRIAERAGIKQRLVYYYFATMDELIVETFHRLSARELDRLGRAGQSAQPLQEIWDVSVHSLDPRLVSEFMTLANRIEPLRQEVIHFIEEARRLQVEVLAAALARNPALSRLSPKALAILASSVALNLLREKDLGVEVGHAGVIELIGGFLAHSDETAGVSSM